MVGVDVDADKVAALSKSQAPFFEPGLPELLAEATATGRLTFTTDLSASAGSVVHFVCVGTPQMPNEYAADITFVNAAFESLLPYLADGDIVVGKSTVPVGTAERLAL